MINKNIEELFKQALEGHELPYDASAWKSLTNKLDKNIPIQSPVKVWRWVLGSVVLISITSLLLWNNAKETGIIKKNEIAENSSKNYKPTKIEKSTNKKDITSQNIQKNKKQALTICTFGEVIEMPTIYTDYNEYENLHIDEIKQADIFSTDEQIEPVPMQENDLIVNSSIVYPTLSFNCIGDKKALSNKNATDLVLVTPSNQQLILPAKSETSVTIEEKGYYRIGTMSSEGIFNEHTNQLVNESPTLDFSLEDQNYINGLPTLPINVKSNETTIAIYLNNKLVGSNLKETEIYLFKKGDNQITVSCSNEFNCKSSITKTVNTVEDYNLLAVNAFDPFSNDARKSTFMPFALTQRKTPFNLIIIDPSDGGIVFESSDASNAWDGYDKRNGKMATANKAYIWKVNIANPEYKENTEYKGTIVRL
jgi:hypothetical protein